ncbi:MAG: acyl-CoA dehydrogenase [Solirubrobacterales bacterium]|nr:acyl-CoA dehydrogenase [Solirubrobacterales bacterium]
MTAVAATASGAAAERDEVVAVARELGRRELAPRGLDLDKRRPGALDAAWGQVAEVGFDRALLAVDDGGVGLDPGSLLLCLEEIAAGDGGVAILVLLANAALAALPAELAAQVGEGKRWALVPAPPEEAPTGARIEVAAREDGTVVVGALSPALGALGADGIVVVGRGAEPAVLALPAGTAGLRIEACEPQLGLRAAAAARISLSDATAEVALPPAEAGAATADSLTLLRAGAAAIGRGIARRAHDLALAYAEERVQGGVPIVEHDAVREMLAAMAVRLAATPSPALGAPAGEAAALAAKLAAADAAVATTTDAVQVFGGTGYMHETGVEKLMRDAKFLQLWPEPSWVARSLLVDLRR